MKIAKSKLIILAIVVVGFVILTLWLFDAISSYEAKSISPDPFEPVATKAISERIEGKDYKTARNAFDSIYMMIDIQGKLILKDGSQPTPVAHIDSLKLSAYNAAVKALIADTDKLFQSSNWSSFPLQDYKSIADYYLELFSQDNFYEPNLKKIIGNINDYYAALRVCRGAGSVTTVAGIQQIGQKVKAYQRNPLTNDSELKSQLNSAVQKAKNSVSAHIANRASYLKNRITTFSSMDEFNAVYYSINDALVSYVNKYDNNSSTNTARSTLVSAKAEAENYFN
ncbi:MAG: hypothetical protein PUD39_04680 [Bacteroidales bacterium]|nr:hypothetical protein [Bacteroidales bacterium]